jgi:Glycosyltransferase family 87
LRTPDPPYELLTRLGKRRVAVVVAAAAVFVAACSLPNVGLFDEGQVGDTPQYRDKGDAFLDGEIPYRDFYVEYPPGALPVFVAPAVGDEEGYPDRFKALMVALGIATIVLVASALTGLGAGDRHFVAALGFVAIVPAALGPVVLVNYDLWPAALTVAALAAILHGRWRLGHAALGLAVAAKLYPIALLPLFFLHVRRRAGRREALASTAVFAAAIAVVVLPFLLLGPGGIRASLESLVRRPLQIESLGASLLLAAHRLGLYDPSVNSDYNSQNLGGDLPDLLAALSSVALAAVAIAVYVLFARRASSRTALVVGCAAAVCASVVLGKVGSPQHLVWLVPLVPLVAGRAGVTASLLLGGALVLTQSWFPNRYGGVVRLGPEAWLVLARNGVLVALLALLVARLRSEPELPRREP